MEHGEDGMDSQFDDDYDEVPASDIEDLKKYLKVIVYRTQKRKKIKKEEHTQEVKATNVNNQ